MNRYTFYKDYIEVEIISQKNGVFQTKISLEDYERCKNYKIGINKYKTHDTYRWYCYIIVNKKLILLHRFIIDAQKGFDVDHINGDTLDNRRINVRQCTRSENNMNRRNNRKCKGIMWYDKFNKYMAYITVDRKRKHLGYFDDFEEAVRIRKEAEIIYHKDFAVKNEVSDNA